MVFTYWVVTQNNIQTKNKDFILILFNGNQNPIFKYSNVRSKA